MRWMLWVGMVWLGVPNAWAWGPEGHAMVADMAEAHLTPAAMQAVQRLLAVEGYRHLDQVSSWPDAIRSQAPDTGPWHYVDIPLYAERYAQSRDCHWDQHNQQVPELTCVVVKLPVFVRVLSDLNQSDERRLEALKWVVHLAGDIHQPLHAEDDHDRGGNDVHLAYFGKATNLHAVWDVGIIEHRFDWQLGLNYSFDHAAVRTQAVRLDQDISAGQRASWAPPGTVAEIADRAVQWVNESHALACQVYRHLPADYSDGWDGEYQVWAWPVVRTQLDKAGVRLAAILNGALQ